MTFTPDDEPEFVPPPYASDDDTSLIDGNHEDDGLTTFTVSVDPSPPPPVEVDPAIDRVGYEKPTKIDWLKFATWALIYPAIIGVIDWWLFERGGYRGTITASSRIILRHYPWVVGLLVGASVSGLTTHFFASFPGARHSLEALIAFVAGWPIGYVVVRSCLYG